MKMPSPEAMKKRFHELKDQRDKQRAKVDPIREKRDALVAEQLKALAAEDAKVKKAEDGLYEIEQEMAMLVRAVGGSMGEPE